MVLDAPRLPAAARELAIELPILIAAAVTILAMLSRWSFAKSKAYIAGALPEAE